MTKEHRDTCYLTPPQELGQAFVARGITGGVVMLNLLVPKLFNDTSVIRCRTSRKQVAKCCFWEMVEGS
jgi:hypothetical protein